MTADHIAIAPAALRIDTASSFMALPSDYHRSVVMPYCGIRFRQGLLQNAEVPLQSLNIHRENVLLEHGDMGVSTLANRAIGANDTVFSVCGPLVSEANVYTVQVGNGKHMIFSGGAEYLAHSCQPNVKLVIEKIDETDSLTKGVAFDAQACIPNLFGSVATPAWWADAQPPSAEQFVFQTEYAIRVIALRPIAKGEVLSFNYLTTEFDMDEPFDCLCGGERSTAVPDASKLPACFGTIQGFRYLPDAYKGLLRPLCTSVVLACDEKLMAQ